MSKSVTQMIDEAAGNEGSPTSAPANESPLPLEIQPLG